MVIGITVDKARELSDLQMDVTLATLAGWRFLRIAHDLSMCGVGPTYTIAGPDMDLPRYTRSDEGAAAAEQLLAPSEMGTFWTQLGLRCEGTNIPRDKATPRQRCDAVIVTVLGRLSRGT